MIICLSYICVFCEVGCLHKDKNPKLIGKKIAFVYVTLYVIWIRPDWIIIIVYIQSLFCY